MRTDKGKKLIDMFNLDYSLRSCMESLNIDFFDLKDLYWEDIHNHIKIERIEKRIKPEVKPNLMAGVSNWFYTIPVDDYFDLGVYHINNGSNDFYSTEKFMNDGRRIYWIREDELVAKSIEVEKLYLIRKRDIIINQIIG